MLLVETPKEVLQMYNFNFYNPVKVLFGAGRLNDLHDEQLPGKKALICIG